MLKIYKYYHYRLYDDNYAFLSLLIDVTCPKLITYYSGLSIRKWFIKIDVHPWYLKYDV